MAFDLQSSRYSRKYYVSEEYMPLKTVNTFVLKKEKNIKPPNYKKVVDSKIVIIHRKGKRIKVLKLNRTRTV